MNQTQYHLLESGRTFTPGASIDRALAGGEMPYAAIFPRGMMERWIKRGWATAQEELGPEAAWWNAASALVEDSWNHCSEVAPDAVIGRMRDTARRLVAHFGTPGTPPVAHATIPSRVLEGFVADALAAGVVSVDQQFQAALDYLTANQGVSLAAAVSAAIGRSVGFGDVESLEVTRVKEGHTSSVFRVAATFPESPTPIAFCLNVARDTTDAASDLEANRVHLTRWSARSPERVAAVLTAGSGRCRWFGQTVDVPVIATRWLDGTRELHAIRAKQDAAKCELVAVDEFLPGATALPQIVGARLNRAEADACWSEVVSLRTELADPDWVAGTVTAPSIEVNHGDVVCAVKDGSITIGIVGASPTCWSGSLAAYPFEVALSGARDPGSLRARRLYWGSPEFAIRAMARGVAHLAPQDPVGAIRRIVDEARTAGAEAALPSLRLGGEDPALQELCSVTERVLASFSTQEDIVEVLSCGS